MFGNGLKSAIWQQFVDRFKIKDIAEFYAATESNTTTINIENKIGAIGFLTVCWPEWARAKFIPLYVIQVDRESGEPVRDTEGHCVVTEPGEPGELIGKIVKGDPIKDFTGYTDKKASEKKILSHVFQKGDSYFRSGDILVRDEFGYLYFKDRTGDTFR
jgi:solute carrier family 27 fatty acid transporter 1/4